MKTDGTTAAAMAHPLSISTTRRTTLRVFAWALALAIALSFSGASAFADDGSSPSTPALNAGATLQVDTQADSASHAKRTIMFYVCGSDLE